MTSVPLPAQRALFAPAPAMRQATARLAENTGLRLWLWLLVATWYLADALAHPYHIGPAQDWQYFAQHALSAWRSWFHYGQLPVWEPYHCGGMTAVGNLQNSAVSLSTLMSGLFGPWPGQKLTFLLWFVAGMEGTYRYARHRQIWGVGAVTAALCFALSGRFAMVFDDGQPIFLAFQLTPWALLCLEKGLRSWRYATAGGAVMALCLLEGGAIPTPLIAIFLGLMTLLLTAEAVIQGLRGEGELPVVPWHRPARTLAWMALVTLGLAAFRALPAVDEIFTHPRVWHGMDVYSIGHVVNMLFFANGQLHYAGDGSSFAGHVTIVLLLLAWVAGDRRTFLPLVASLLLLDLSTGGGEFLGLFLWLKRLPVLENLRNPFRFAIFIAFFVALGAGCGISLLEHHLLTWRDRLAPRAGTSPRLRWLVTALALLAVTAVGVASVYDLTLFTRRRMAKTFTQAVPRMVEQPFRQSVGNRWVAGIWPAANLGTLQCFEEQPFFTSAALRGDLPQEEYLALPDAGQVQRLSWSPHRIELAVDLSEAATLLVNQNAHRGWQTDTGRIVPYKGLVAVALPAGKRRVVLTFADPLVQAGLGISALTALLLLAWGLRGLWRRRRPGPSKED